MHKVEYSSAYKGKRKQNQLPLLYITITIKSKQTTKESEQKFGDVD